MKIIDTFILIAAAWYAFKGFKHGLLSEIFYLLALIAGAWAAIYGNQIVLEYINIEHPAADIIAIVLTFALVATIILLTGKLCQSIVTSVFSGIFNNLLGGLFGIIKVALTAGLLFCFLAQLDPQEKVFTAERKQASLCYAPCTTMVRIVAPPFQTLKIRLQTSNWQEQKN
ncbi:MAG: CvpA family protein [Bacteroidales bacterium]|nr:CvpA family protein [Bacteroidales bacterium]